MDELEDIGWLSPFFESRWHISPEQLGPPPREARRYTPPITGSSRRMQLWLMLGLGAALVWLAARWLADKSLAAPTIAVAVAAVFSGSVLLLPRLMHTRRGPTIEVADQLEMGRTGRVAVAVVERVDYGRRKMHAGYRDGHAIDTSSGRARARFVAEGASQTMWIDFLPGEPVLRDGDEVTVLYDPADPSRHMPLRSMQDVQLETVGAA